MVVFAEIKDWLEPIKLLHSCLDSLNTQNQPSERYIRSSIGQMWMDFPKKIVMGPKRSNRYEQPLT